MISKHQRPPVEPLSARIFRLRIARGYSIYELAKAADVFAGTLQRLESGKPVDKHVMSALAVALDIPLCQLVCGEHDCAERACVPPYRLRRVRLSAPVILGDMTIKRLDHVSVVVDDLAAAIAFFTALGMTLEGEMPVEGPWVDRVNGLESVQVDIVMMRTPDGHGRLELTKFRNPKLVEIEPAIAPPNTLGLRSVMFTVESVDDTVARLRANGAELVGEVAQYEDMYRLCYMRGPAGIIVALAEELF